MDRRPKDCGLVPYDEDSRLKIGNPSEPLILKLDNMLNESISGFKIEDTHKLVLHVEYVKQEEHVNEDFLENIPIAGATFSSNKSTSEKEGVRITSDDLATEQSYTLF